MSHTQRENNTYSNALKSNKERFVHRTTKSRRVLKLIVMISLTAMFSLTSIGCAEFNPILGGEGANPPKTDSEDLFITDDKSKEERSVGNDVASEDDEEVPEAVAAEESTTDTSDGRQE
jgi:hypothetical protein